MKFLVNINRGVRALSQGMNRISSFSVFFMMTVTCADVILRFFRHPLTGTYEMVGFSGAVAVSFALALTAIERGNIAVDFLVQRFSKKTQAWVERVNDLVLAVLFACIAWHSLAFALSSRQNNEVSMTLQLPVYPFILGIALSFGLLFLVSVLRFLLSFSSPDALESI